MLFHNGNKRILTICTTIVDVVKATTVGPILGPIVSGFASGVGWRWPFWISLIANGICLIPVVFLPGKIVLISSLNVTV